MLSDRYRILKGFPSKSGSRTDIMVIQDKVDNKDYIFKIFVEDYILNTPNGRYHKKTIDQETLIHEIRMYKTIKEHIIIPFNVRNILCISGDGTFNKKEYFNLIQKSTDLAPRQIENNIIENTLFMLSYSDKRQPIDTKIPMENIKFRRHTWFNNQSWIDWTQPIVYHCIITPRIQSLNLQKVVQEGMQTRMLNANRFMNYMFIILLTEFIMSSFGLNQNDLHWQNILMDDKYFGPSDKHKLTYLLVYNNTILLVDNPYIPYIYDFDRTAMRNKYFKFLDNKSFVSGGNCPTYHSKRDFIRTLCMIYSMIDDTASDVPEFQEIQKDIFSFIPNSRIQNIIRKDLKTSCWLEDIDNVSVSCKPNLLKDIASSDVILNWALSKTEYKRFTLDELLDIEQKKKESSYYSNVKNIIDSFGKGLDPKDMNSIYANIQFIQKDDIYFWDENYRKTKFVELVQDILLN